MSDFESPQYRLASAIKAVGSRVEKLEAFDNAIFEIKTTTGRPTARGNYHFVINTFDNTCEIYVDGSWEDMISGGGGAYTDEDAQDAIGTIWADTATTDFTYDDVTPEMKIDVKDVFVFNTGDQIDGNLIIDNTDTEAFLVRQDADAADVFIVDTTNRRIGVNGTPSHPVHIHQIADSSAFHIGGYDDKSAEFIKMYVTSLGVGAIWASDDLSLLSDSCRIRLNDNAGVEDFIIWDSDYANVFNIDSNGNFTSQGKGIIDATNTEAFLVRQDADAADVFIVDTTNRRVGVNGAPSYPFHISQIADGSAMGISGYDDKSAEWMKLYLDGNAYGNIETSDRLVLHTDSNLVIRLGDTSGSNKIDIQDSGITTVVTINSDGNYVGQGTMILDATSTEALLVRQDADAADVFIVNTTNRRIGVNGAPTTPLEILQIADSSALQISGYDDKSADNIHAYINSAGAGVINATDDFQILGDSIRLRLGDNAAAESFVIWDSDFANVFSMNSNGVAFFEGVVKIKERAAAVADSAGYGQLWVKTATPCELWFTDDAGTDTQIV